ncbi:MAG TPA: trehalose-phosphatase [Polyangiaceae bacterium]|nr:trehalose-phosphatase [Polyangiaceae bacterium]
MKHILAAAHVNLLAQLAWSSVLLAFDFDGTLAPIVEDRDEACMRVRTRQLLERVCALYPCAVISGRSRADVLARLDGVHVPHVIGNHGMEPGTRMKTFERQIEQIRPVLTHALADFPGVDLEDKRFSLAIHYRRSRRKRQARCAILHAVASLSPPVRTIPGKLVFNLVPANAPHKGDAVAMLRDKLGADTAVFVGDDVTDEDVFSLDQPGRLLSIRVGMSKTSSADYYLRDQREIDALLRYLVRIRQKEGHP